MAYTNNNGQIRVGVRSGITNSPIQPNTVSASLLQSLYGVWNGDTTTNELGTSLYGVWNAEYSGTASLETSLYGVWNGESTTNTLDTSLYALYKAEGNANDSVGTNHGTLLNGATFSTGKIGTKSFYFDGVNDYISLPNNSLNFTGDFSISVWVDVSSISTWQHVFNPVNNISGNYGWRLVINGNSYAFNIGNGTAITQLYFEATYDSIAQISPLVGTAMKNVVITRKAGVGTKMYINGVLKASNNSIVNPSYLSTMTPKFGDGNTINKLDNIGFWNKELSDLEAIQLYNNNVGIDYPFNGNLLQSTNDVFGSNHGTLMNGTTFTTGKIGNAFSFDGVNDYVKFSNNSLNYTNSNSFSVSMWVYASRTNVYQILIASYTFTGQGYGWFVRLAPGSDPANNCYIEFGTDNQPGTGNPIFLRSTTLVNKNSWNLITVTRNGSTGAERLYVNGTLSGSRTLTTNYLFNSSITFYPTLGANQWSPTNIDSYFQGMLDSVNVWNRELTSNEVSMLYNGSNGTQYQSGSFGLTQSSLDSFGTNHGALVNTTYGTGISGNAFQFNGTSAYVSFPTNSWNSLVGTDLTISLWVKFTSTSNQTLISNMSSPSINVWSGWEIRLDGGRPTIYMWNNSGTGVGAQGAVVSTNTWYHIVATRKKGSRTRIYINGSLAQTDTNTPDPSISGTYYPNIGHLQYSSSYHGLYMTNGSLIDSVNLWSKEISADEVTQLYNSGTGAQYPFSGTFSSAINQLGVDNGTLMNGCYLSDGKIGKAFTFDGINDFVLLPTNSMRFTGDFSYSFFVSLGNTSGEQTILACENYLSNENGDKGYVISFNNGILKFYGYYNNTIIIDSSSTTTVTANTWYHFAVTKTSSQVKIYMNGVLQKTTNYTGILTYNSVVYPAIGVMYKQNNVNNNNYHYISAGSKIDALTAYQKELTQSEITELYNSGNGKQITATPIVQSGLVLNLDASRTSSYTGTGTSWTDISGNSNNGTMVNGPVFGTASGGQISFDGVNDYVDCGDVLDMGTKSYTINIWIKLNSVSSQTFVSKALAGLQNYRFAVGVGNFGANNKLSAFMQGNTFGADVTPNGTTSLPLNTWFMATFVFDRSSSISIYYNGTNDTLVGSGVISQWNGLDFQSNNPFRIGSYTDSNNSTPINFTNGVIGTTQIYNRALSPTEITQNFNATKGRFGL